MLFIPLEYMDRGYQAHFSEGNSIFLKKKVTYYKGYIQYIKQVLDQAIGNWLSFL